MAKKNMSKIRRGTSRRPKQGNAVGEYAADAWSLAKRTAQGLNEIRKLINVEQKFHEVANSVTYDRNGSVVFVSGIAQGDAVGEREGNSLKVQTFRFNYFLKHNSAQTTGACHRVLVVRDMQNQGTTITANDVLQTVGTVQAPLAMRDFINGPLQNKRFAIVYDQILVTDPTHLIRQDEFSTNHDVHVYYRGTGNTDASAGNGAYFLVFLSSETSNLPEIFYNTRMEFTDN